MSRLALLQSLITPTPRLPFFARPALSLGVRLGIIRSDKLETVLRYLETADEVVNWWPPISLIILSIFLLLLSFGLLIGSIVEFIRQLYPQWLAWLEVILSVTAFWSPLFLLVIHYRNKIRSLHEFAVEEGDRVRTVAGQTSAAVARGSADLREKGNQQLGRIREAGSEQLERVRDGSREQLGRLQGAGSAGLDKLKSRFRSGKQMEPDE